MKHFFCHAFLNISIGVCWNMLNFLFDTLIQLLSPIVGVNNCHL